MRRVAEKYILDIGRNSIALVLKMNGPSVLPEFTVTSEQGQSDPVPSAGVTRQ